MVILLSTVHSAFLMLRDDNREAMFIALALCAIALISGGVVARLWGFRITALVDRVVVYTVLAALLLGFYVATSLAVTSLIPAGNILANESMAVATALFVAITYSPASTLVQRLVDRLLYRDYYDYEKTLQIFSRELAATHDRDAVIDLMLRGLSSTFNLTGIAFVPLPESLDQSVLTMIEPDDIRVRGSFSAPENKQALLNQLAALPPRVSRLLPSTRLVVTPWKGCAALALIGGDPGEGVAALLVLGEKVAGALRREDGALLITLAHQAATALANAQLVSGLRISLQQLQLSTTQLREVRAEQELLLRELVNAEERERASLARELHDDALQEVLYTIRHAQLAERLADTIEQEAQQLAMLPTALSLDPADSANRISTTYLRLRRELGELAERSVIAERKLRALCLGLYPDMLHSLGLIPALDDLAEQAFSSTGVRVAIEYDDSVAAALEHLEPNVALHLYRIVQEALSNAHKHGSAHAATVSLRADDMSQEAVGTRFMLELQIRDDGAGIPLPVDFGAALAAGHLGLASMRERVQLIQGRLAFDHVPGGGTLVSVTTALDVQPAR